ncbi:MAG: archease [Thaumarchaeota archaeon]|nr:archease [Nitrososphaerota archaeon]
MNRASKDGVRFRLRAIKSFEWGGAQPMVVPYEFLPDVALADIAFEANSRTLNGLFQSCAIALTEVMVDRKTLKPRSRKEISLSSETLDTLLYDFLTEMIIMKDVISFLAKRVTVRVDPTRPSLKCELGGETISRSRHKLRNDVKAVTMHMFGIKKTPEGWATTVVLDI